MILRKIGEKHGFSYSCHDLRRYYATSLAKKGVPVPLIAKVLGHESIATTQRYLFINYADVFSFFDTFGAN